MQLEFENLTVRYGEREALKPFNACLREGGLIGLIGPNGAGKSTLLRCTATLLRPSAGRLYLDGADVTRQPALLRRVLGYLPQEPALYPELTPREFLAYMAAVRGLPRRAARRQADSLFALLHLEGAASRRIASLSGGMRQRVGIACALLGDPQVLVLDEPASGLDPQERAALRELLASLAQKRLVLVSTHIVADVEAAASDLLLMQDGRLIFHGAPRALTRRAAGKVWQYRAESARALPEGALVSGLVQEENGVRVRALGSDPPVPDACAVEATLEDACLLAMKEAAVCVC